jgi:hypothetical protein
MQQQPAIDEEQRKRSEKNLKEDLFFFFLETNEKDLFFQYLQLFADKIPKEKYFHLLQQEFPQVKAAAEAFISQFFTLLQDDLQQLFLSASASAVSESINLQNLIKSNPKIQQTLNTLCSHYIPTPPGTVMSKIEDPALPVNLPVDPLPLPSSKIPNEGMIQRSDPRQRSKYL